MGKSDKLSEVDRMLRFLETRKKLKKSVSADLRGLFEEKLPERIRYSYTYADLTADNFVFDVAGELKLIDIGSLQEARLTDIFLFSHPTLISILALKISPVSVRHHVFVVPRCVPKLKF